MVVKVNYYKLAMQTIYEISNVLNNSSYKKTCLENVLNILKSNLQIKRGFILLYDNIAKNLYIGASIGINKEQEKVIRYNVGEGIVGKVFKIGSPMIVSDVSREPLFLDKIERSEKKEELSFLAVPIKDGREVIGVLALDKDVASIYTYSSEIDLLKMISNLISAFLKRIDNLEQERAKYLEEKLRLENELKSRFSFKGLIGKSKAMQSVCKSIAMTAKTKTTVLIRGESGTGKEIVAKTIHYNSDRKDKPFVAINCASIPMELIESELFGHEKGAFTGATYQKKGKFELADGGTILLDEIGDMPLQAQSKLLRVLQEKKISRIGGQRDIDIDVRVIAATNKDLEEEIQKGNFRLDLYYRLNIVTIYIPPLRKRREDIPFLTEHFLQKINKEYGKNVKLDKDALDVLMRCKWPGNIRELESCIERAVLFTEGAIVTKENLSCQRGMPCLGIFEENNSKAEDNNIGDNLEEPVIYDKDEMILTEISSIEEALKKTGFVKAKAARLLNMTVRQLDYRIKKYGIKINSF